MRLRMVCLTAFFLLLLTCGTKKEVPVIRTVDRQTMKMVVLTGTRTKIQKTYTTDFVVIGGGISGLAATLTVCLSGRRVVLIEESDHIASDLSPNDTTCFFDSVLHEKSGYSKRFRLFRSKIQEWYRAHSRQLPKLSPPYQSTIRDFGRNNLCCENRACIDVINDMLKERVENGSLIILKRHKVVEVVEFHQRIASLRLVDLDNKVVNQVEIGRAHV